MDVKLYYYIGAKPEVVWDILTTPEGTRKAFYGSPLRSTFEIGADYAYIGPGNDGDETVHVYGEVLAFEPNRLISVSEHPGPSYHANHAELETRVTMTLETAGNCTLLTVVNDQWTENHPSRANAEKNWSAILCNIKTLAETDKTLDLGW